MHSALDGSVSSAKRRFPWLSGSAAPSFIVELRAFPEGPQRGGKKDLAGEVAIFFADTQLLTLPSCLLL